MEAQSSGAMTRFEPGAAQIARPSTFSPTTFSEAMQFSDLIAKSDLAPKDFRGKPANVMIAMQMGAEVGLAPMQAIQNIAVINGRPCLWGDAALAVVQAHPAYEWHKEYMEGEGDARTVVFQIKRRGHEAHEVRFGVAEAKKAGLLNKEGPWRNYPERMMQMRARGFGLRDKFADALRGIVTAEEAMDTPAPAVTATQTAPSLPAGNPEPEKPKNPEPKPDSRFISQGQIKRMWAMARERNWPETQLRNLLGRFGFEHSDEVTKDSYDEICHLIETCPNQRK